MNGSKSNKQYIIALDLDDTLLNSKGEVSETTLKTIQEFKEKGFIIVISSTRGFSTCTKVADLILPHYICCQAGNMIIDNNKEIIYKNPFTKEDSLNLIETFKDISNSIVIDSDFGLYGIAADKFISRWGLHYCELSTLVNRNAYKFCIGFDNTDTQQKIEEYCNSKHYVCRKMIDDNYMFITPANSNKYYALEHLMKKLNISPKNLIVFGDDSSDKLSIEKAGFGVAMQNSKPDILASAKYTTLSNDEDGVAHFLNKHFK